MKQTKRFASIATAALLAACAVVPSMASIPASAADTTYTITINNDATGHTYEAYQIFSGSLGEGNTLGNITWGVGVDTEASGFLTAIQAVEDKDGKTPFAGKTTANDIAKILGDNNTDATLATNFASAVGKFLSATAQATQAAQSDDSDGDEVKEYKLSGLNAGYYLVKDKNDTLAGKDDAYTSFIMKVVANATATPKSATPTVDKQVLDETGDAEAGATEGWGESADHAINESFQFKLTATLPADTDFASYDAYKVVFNDTMSEGVTFENIASVKVGNTEVQPTGYTSTAKANQAGGDWTLTIADIKQYVNDLSAGTTVEVVYNAHLNEKAVVSKANGTALDVNNNKVNLEYSNNPNVTGGNELGKTTDDYVWVFTYEVDNTKVDQDKKPLADAGFKLYDSTGTTEIGLTYDTTKAAYRPIAAGETATEMKSAASTGVFNIIGLDAGTYVLKETSTPAGYNTCDPIEIKIEATHVENANATSADLTLTMTNGVNEIVNQKGSTLPSTGGIGTTIFYVAGGVLVVGAGVLLITKKRAKNMEA